MNLLPAAKLRKGVFVWLVSAIFFLCAPAGTNAQGKPWGGRPKRGPNIPSSTTA